MRENVVPDSWFSIECNAEALKTQLMDVLVGSIDVRELLSTEDLDETSPLSAPDLRLLIDRLQIRSLHIKTKVRDYVLSHHNEFADIFSRCAAAASGADDTIDALADVIRILSDRPVDREIRDLAEEIVSKRRELEYRREALAVVRTISSLLERLKVARENVRAGRLVEAAVVLRDLKKGLWVSDEDDDRREEEEPAVFEFLKKDWLVCFDELQYALSRSLENLIRFEPEDGTVTVRSIFTSDKTDEIELHRVLQAMEVVDVLDYGLSKVADLMIKHAIGPAITNEGISISEDYNLDSVGILRINLLSEPHEDTGLVTILSNLHQIVKFIYKSVCFENGIWMQCFGRLTWSRMSDLIISHSLSKAVPEDASKMAEFENIIRCISEFENTLKEMKFISFDNNNEERLSHFARNVEVHFASKRKKEILAKARKVLQFSSLEGMPNSGTNSYDTCEGPYGRIVDLLFQPERCFISGALCQVIQLVHETLKDACLSSARVAKELYHASRDVLLLYKAIVPMKLAKQLSIVSQQAIIMHNDCYYLSQEIPGFAFEYRADFPLCLKNFIVFVDIAPSFYQMAENLLQKQIQLVVNDLKEAIDGADGFQNTHQPHQFELATFSINQVIFILEKVRIIWEPLMVTSTYKRTMCVLLDSFFSRLTKDLLLLDDLAAEETLQRLIHMALENLSPLFQSVTTEIEKNNKLMKDSSLSLLDDQVPSFRKLERLADLFDMPLKSITSIWENGELFKCGFTSSEVENFIRAVFTDSPLRKECLLRIESANL